MRFAGHACVRSGLDPWQWATHLQLGALDGHLLDLNGMHLGKPACLICRSLFGLLQLLLQLLSSLVGGIKGLLHGQSQSQHLQYMASKQFMCQLWVAAAGDMFWHSRQPAATPTFISFILISASDARVSASTALSMAALSSSSCTHRRLNMIAGRGACVAGANGQGYA